MRLFTTIAGIRCYLQQSHPRCSVGFVPTMGALHIGHLSLIERARAENKLVIVSIFVNPLQFGPKEDFQQYPRQLEADRDLCATAGVDAIFAPSAQEMLAQATENPTQVIPPQQMIEVLCGKSRPGHFQGVATIVTKLLQVIQPNRAYFGEKDAQQLAIIRRLVQDLNIPVEIVGCPTVRLESGLAYSSRNQYLSELEREDAVRLSQGLFIAKKNYLQGERRSDKLISAVADRIGLAKRIEIEYIELVDPVNLNPLSTVEESGLLAVAARLGSTRLIDNILLKDRQPIVAIDGPAGAGKSTVARKVAESLGLIYLDTGAMYRAVTWLVLETGIKTDDEPAIAELVSQCDLKLTNSQVLIDGHDVTSQIRSWEVTDRVSAIAALPSVRRFLVEIQHQMGQKGGLVAEGRDIGTNVFPDAEIKIFLTASIQERARRRQQDLISQGQTEVSLSELELAIEKRDRQDSTRSLAPLLKADDAIEIDTDKLTVEEVIAQIVGLYRKNQEYRTQGSDLSPT
ncbi:bifunctional pantoate--beta-alanine ligase/(d)CMP kinase [Merismopedia glauca]|uniref:Bifunctional pantoate ligase/cytidylate kinase n=1 Tax=Merismopedia glauca CCAP 1448/3 TaxID=1296344 RepID=A0A2T1C1S4_9CYAN|nr:bifunctional pantoate--beta-alanine ligase/(d)CMP kinase [Merismopedia glauca]PSB02235.1 cytidylate kinase [Merismopedia glauca CCAP 1448/3]